MFYKLWPVRAIIVFTVVFFMKPIHAEVDQVKVNLSAADAQGSNIISQVESGHSHSVRMGSAVWLQTLIEKDKETLRGVLGGDYSRLNEILPEVAFTKRFTDADSPDLLYMKLRGFGSGIGAIFEVQNDLDLGGNDSASVLKGILPAGFLDLPGSDISPMESSLRSEIERLNASGSAESRSLGAFERIHLTGPLNELIEFPGLRVELEISLADYSIRKTGDSTPLDALINGGIGNSSKVELSDFVDQAQDLTYVMIKIEFSPAPTKEHLADVNGYLSDAKLMALEHSTKKLLGALKIRAKKI